MWGKQCLPFLVKDMNNKEKMKLVLDILEKEYNIPGIFLNHENEYQLMVAVILSAQCTDDRVNMTTNTLFKYIKTPYDMDKMNINFLKKLIFSCGFYNNKAKNLKANAKELIEKYNGILPRDIDKLTELPGVGRKTANVLLYDLWHISQGIVVDTHVKKLAFELGFTKSKNPLTIEQDLMKITPKKYWGLLSKYFILHGRKKCKINKLQCKICDLKI